MSAAPIDVAESLFAQLEHAWNAADGVAYGEAFTEDADFVDIRGAHHTTRAAIAYGHQAIFDSIYKASVLRLKVTDAREVAPGCTVAHVSGVLEAPSGPLAGTHRTTMTGVATSGRIGWRLAACHNTLVVE